MSHDTTTPARVRWARLRFAIIGPLLSAPAEAGDLAPRIEELAARAWRHPSTGDTIRFSAKSIERWYYAARHEQDPIRALERKVPKHAGTHPSVTAEVAEAIRTLRKQHPRWSYQLVHDNLVAVGREQPELGVLPGYATVSRFMKHHGLGKHRRPRRHEQEPGFVPARAATLRGRPRARAVALRFPRRQTQSRERQRRLGHGHPVCGARRSLAAVLPRAVVRGRRQHRELRARPLPGVSEARASTRAPLRFCAAAQNLSSVPALDMWPRARARGNAAGRASIPAT